LEKDHRYQVEKRINSYFYFSFLIEQAKAHSRELRKTDRELVRDRNKLEAEEQRIVNFYFNLNEIFHFDFIF
jgi:hypothetical protein